MTNYYKGNFPGTLIHLRRFLHRFADYVHEKYIPGHILPKLLELCYKDDYIHIRPWAGIDIFIRDDDTVEIKRIWAYDLEDWEKVKDEIPIGDERNLSEEEFAWKIEEYNIEKLRERRTILEKISDALRNLQELSFPNSRGYQLQGIKDETIVVGPDEFTIPNMSMGKALKILQWMANKDIEPAIIELLHEQGSLPGVIKYKRPDNDGMRVADELQMGSFRIIPNQNPDGVRVFFEQRDFPDYDLFSGMANLIMRMLWEQNPLCTIDNFDIDGHLDHLYGEHEPLTFEELDAVVLQNLDRLDPARYIIEREERGYHMILYTITAEGKLLGRYCVASRDDGSNDYGPIQGVGSEWNKIWRDILFVMIKRAELEKAKSFVKQIKNKDINVATRSVQVTDAREMPRKKKLIDGLCIKWVNRGYLPKYNMSDFLQEHEAEIYVTVPEFKRALKDAYKRSLIRKDLKTGRYIPKTGS